MGKLDKMRAEVGGNVEESTAGPDLKPGPLGQRLPTRPPNMVGVDRAKDAAVIELGQIVPDPDQPRKEFTPEQLREMEGSLREKGQLQPIRVRWDEALGKYMVIMGERRYRAALNVGMKSLAAVIHQAPLSAAEVLEIQVIENTVREDLKPIEKATAIRRLIDEFGYTQEQVGDKLKMSQPSIARSLSLLELHPEIQAKVEDGKISKMAAHQIAKVDSPEGQLEVAARVEEGNLTEQETARVVKKVSKRPSSKAKPGKGRAATAKPRKLTSKVFSFNGIKIEARRGRGFELPELLPALAEFEKFVRENSDAVA